MAVGLKLAPPRSPPMKLKPMTRRNTKKMVIARGAQARLCTPAAADMAAVRAPREEAQMIHKKVTAMSPTAAFTIPIDNESTDPNSKRQQPLVYKLATPLFYFQVSTHLPFT